jgi:hypothetical protein
MKILTTITFFSIVLFASISYGQEINQVKSVIKEQAELQKSVQEGSITIYFSPQKDAEKLASSAAYYTAYFTVKYDPLTAKAVITFVDKSKASIQVLNRFFVSNEIDEVIFGDELLSAGEFVSKCM